MRNKQKIVEVIVSHESDGDSHSSTSLIASNDELFSPLHLACKRGYTRIVRLLVDCVTKELVKVRITKEIMI
jgi:hypothetical protein